jgi:hypothetical protein
VEWIGTTCSGGGLEPHFRVLFSAVFHVFPPEIAIRVENGGFSRKQICCKLLQVYVHCIFELYPIKIAHPVSVSVLVTPSRHYGNQGSMSLSESSARRLPGWAARSNGIGRVRRSLGRDDHGSGVARSSTKRSISSCAIGVQQISRSRGSGALRFTPSHSIAATFLLDPYYLTHRYRTMRPSRRIGRSIFVRSRRLRVSIETFHRRASSRLVNRESVSSPLLTASRL